MYGMVAKIGIITAISAIMSIPPFGTIKIPIFMVDATLGHLPTVIISILEGPLYGAICGLFLGIISMIRCLTEPAGLNLLIWNPLISVLPRILIGITTAYSYRGLRALFSKGAKSGDAVAVVVSAAIGSVTNTIGVLGMIFVIYYDKLTEMLAESEIIQKAGAFLLGIGVANGLCEMVLVAALALVLVKALRRAGYR